jgi:hypothetical protein
MILRERKRLKFNPKPKLGMSNENYRSYEVTIYFRSSLEKRRKFKAGASLHQENLCIR